MKLMHIAALALTALAVTALAGVGTPDQARSAPEDLDRRDEITVSGSGSVTTVPNRALFSFGSESQGKTARATLTANAAEIGAIIARLKASGIGAAEIQTQSVSINPRYSDDGQSIVGYSASNTVAAELRDLARAGAVIDAAVDAGANHVYGPSFLRSDRGELYERALEAAFADARGKARVLASAAGVQLGRATVLAEASGAPEPYALAEDSEARAKLAVPVEPGRQEVEATLTVSFAIS